MLEMQHLDQGAGLRQWATSVTSHLITVMHHGDKSAEMAALWKICTRLQRLGYPLVVLDATAEESSGSPGLQDMLGQARLPQHVNSATWTVIPAASGLRQLNMARPPSGSFEHDLRRLFPDFGAVVVYANAQVVAESTGSNGGCLVVPVSPDTRSLLSAYGSLKQLAQPGLIGQAALVSVSTRATPRQLAQRIAKSLQNCTMKHLKCRLQHFNLSSDFDAENQTDGIRPLVVYLLEHAAMAGDMTDQRLWSH